MSGFVRRGSGASDIASDPHRRWRLLESVTVSRVEGELVLSRGSIALRIRGGHTLIGQLQGRGVASTAAHSFEATELFSALNDLGWVTTERMSAQHMGRPLERQQGYLTLFGTAPVRMQEKLSNARVGIIGIGGVGSVFVQLLASVGVRNYALVDHDVVAHNNLNRQVIFSPHDVGALKVDVARRYLDQVRGDAVVETLAVEVTAPRSLVGLRNDLDVLVVAADQPRDIGAICWRWAQARGIPVVQVGVGLERGFWGPLLDPRRGDCWSCAQRSRKEKLNRLERALEMVESRPTPFSFGPSNAVIAALAAHDVTLFLATDGCKSLGRLIVFDLEGLRSVTVDCHGCDCDGGAATGDSP